MLPIAYQVYSARDEAASNLESVFSALADMGYNGVEFAGFYGHDADTIKGLLDKYGLKAISSHVSADLILADMFGVIAYHQKIGCPYIAIPYLDDNSRPGAAGFGKTLRWIRKFGALCKEAGIQLMYHNHDFEFVRMSEQYGLDFLYDAIDPAYLATEFDTCWIKYAGLNPADYIRSYAGRCPVVHLKDFVGVKGEGNPYGLLGGADASENVAFSFKPIGSGVQDIPSIVKAAMESGAHWLVVEMDDSPEMSPLDAAKVSITYLRSLGL